ncbi:hypothetical protein OPT61_g2943 [Boeremia exigua]|uniref:Uncharacterized protein n=1 Tax=Boeremia exigua TaxID=749465 RepID=A0ACC2IJW8_9PLEO|nr:hypothetical protein OPT61_g2943 [Boeremia exigua]
MIIVNPTPRHLHLPLQAAEGISSQSSAGLLASLTASSKEKHPSVEPAIVESLHYSGRGFSSQIAQTPHPERTQTELQGFCRLQRSPPLDPQAETYSGFLPGTMEEGQPHPDTLVGHDTAAFKRPRADSGSSTSIESVRSVRSVNSGDLEYVHENGRTYGNDSYFNPCVFEADLKEQDRLLFQHQIFVHALQGRLTTTRLLPSTRRILDLGTGPGHWAVAMAQTHPRAEVVGIDMTQWDLDTTEATMGSAPVTWELDDLDVWGVDSHMEELSTISNFDFYRDMMHRTPVHSPPRSPGAAQFNKSISYPEESLITNPYSLNPQPEPGWHFSEPYELIHLRNMKGAFSHWEEVYAEVHKSLSPGGWIEVADWDMGAVPIDHATADPATFPIPTLRKLYASMMEASYKSGRPLGLFYMHPSYLEEAGFTDIQTTQVNVPIGQWVNDEEQKRIGKLLLVVVMEGFEASLLRLLTKFGDRERIWSAEEVRKDIGRAQLEVADWVERPALSLLVFVIELVQLKLLRTPDALLIFDLSKALLVSRVRVRGGTVSASQSWVIPPRPAAAQAQATHAPDLPAACTHGTGQQQTSSNTPAR